MRVGPTSGQLWAMTIKYIYAFQGRRLLRTCCSLPICTKTSWWLPLTQNYRSRAEVWPSPNKFLAKTETRLHHNFSGISKDLAAAAGTAGGNHNRRAVYQRCSQYAWVAQQVKQLQQQGTPLKEIAVLAPKHQF